MHACSFYFFFEVQGGCKDSVWHRDGLHARPKNADKNSGARETGERTRTRRQEDKGI